MIQKGHFMDIIGVDLREKIKEIGQLWKMSENRPTIPLSVLDSWERLISDWIADKSLPLVIRKSSARGQEFQHPSGRRIIVSDNTFAQWVYRNVLEGKTFSIGEIHMMFDRNVVPMVYALKTEEKIVAKHTKILGEFSLSQAGVKWKLCHIEPVGLNSRKHVNELSIELLEEHFKRYASPKNMFVLPKEIGGLGEIKEFIDEQRY